MKPIGAGIMPSTRTAAGSPCSAPSAIASMPADHPDTMAAVQLLARAIGRGSSIYGSVFVQDFNDTHSNAEVLALLDKAIVLAESDAAKEPVALPEPPDAGPEPSWRNQLPC